MHLTFYKILISVVFGQYNIVISKMEISYYKQPCVSWAVKEHKKEDKNNHIIW